MYEKDKTSHFPDSFKQTEVWRFKWPTRLELQLQYSWETECINLCAADSKVTLNDDT